MPNVKIDAPLSILPILRMSVEPQVGHLGMYWGLVVGCALNKYLS